ncbi:MAG: ISNCY family transposase, partial [Gemmatimonadales bacterium]
MFYPRAAVERAMKVQEVLLRAMSGELRWLQAADILGWSPRTLRRWRRRYDRWGYDGLWDRRRHRPSPRRAPLAEVERILRLYREQYRGFNVRHFHQLARRAHGVTLSYSFLKLALQEAGLVRKRRARGRHRRRRAPRPCYGELLHLDGSPHAWLALCPEERQTVLTVLDDATKRLLYAQLWPAETTEAVLTALRAVFEPHGLPIALYTDRAGWAFHTPTAGGRVDRTQLTQVGRALARLGIEHIPAYSPQARGRSERLNRTLQDRLVNELRVAGITTLAAANAYLRDRFIPDYTATFTRPPADPASAFVPLGSADLTQILCHEEERTVGQDNTVVLDGVVLQLAKQPGRRTCAGLRVTVRRHLDGRHTLWRGPQGLGHYDAQGHPTPAPPHRAPRRSAGFIALRRRLRPNIRAPHLAQDRRSRPRQYPGTPPNRTSRRARAASPLPPT